MPHLSDGYKGPKNAYIIDVTSFAPTYGLAVMMLAGPSNILVKIHQSKEVKRVGRIIQRNLATID
jgi:hypothetical protein